MNLEKDSAGKLYMRYLVPSIGATLVSCIYILADAIIIGKGVNALGMAALNILAPVFTLFFGTGILFGVGGAVHYSVEMGKKEERAAKEYFTTSVYSTIAVAVFYLLIFYSGFDILANVLGATDSTIQYVKEYGYILVGGAPLFLISSMLQNFVRNDKDPVLAMAGVITGGVTNVVLDYVFVMKCKMGMSGGAIATLIGSFFTVCILSMHFFRKENHLSFLINGFSSKKLKTILICGFPSFIIEVSNGITVGLFNQQLGRKMGDIGLTVYSVVANCALVASALSNGVSQAAQPIMAANYGAGKKERVQTVFHFGMVTAVCAGTLMIFSGLLLPEQITSIFIEPKPEILAVSNGAVKIYFLSFLAMACNILLSSYFQSIMKPLWSMVICLLRGVVLSGILLFVIPELFGIAVIWSVMPVAEFLTLGTAVLFYGIEKKKKDIPFVE